MLWNPVVFTFKVLGVALLLGPVFNPAEAQEFENDSQVILALQSKIRASKLVIFGEAHGDYNAKTHYPDLLRGIKKLDPDFDCVTFEIEADGQAHLEQFAHGHINFDEYIQEFLPNELAEDIAQAYTDRVKKDFLNWANLSREAIHLGQSVFTIDTERDDYKDTLAYRNSEMAKRIQHLLKTGRCKKIFAVGGAHHLAHPAVFDYIPDVPTLAINMVSESYKQKYETYEAITDLISTDHVLMIFGAQSILLKNR